MLDLSFVEQIRIDVGLACGRVEDLFLDHRVHRQHAADPSRKCALVAGVTVAVGEHLVILEQRIDLVVVLLQEVDGIRFRFGRRRDCRDDFVEN